MEKVTADLEDIVRELELEMEAKDVTELLQSHGQTLIDEDLFLMDEQRKQFLETKYIPGEYTVKSVEQTTKALEY